MQEGRRSVQEGRRSVIKATAWALARGEHRTVQDGWRCRGWNSLKELEEHWTSLLGVRPISVPGTGGASGIRAGQMLCFKGSA